MSAKRIYMDSDMLESYANYNDAANHFLDTIALENIHLDTEIQLEFGIADDDLFSEYAMEAIGETVKNMASKAKSNFVTYAKKLINFLFGWLINFFRGAANVKKTMANAYTKAKDYLKKLNELERKARGANKEETIEITDFGNCVLVGLTMMQAIMVSSENLGKAMGDIARTKSGSEKDEKSAIKNRAFRMVDELLRRMEQLYALIGSIDISKPDTLIQKLRTSQYNVGKVIEGYQGKASKEVKSSYKEARIERNKAKAAERKSFMDKAAGAVSDAKQGAKNAAGAAAKKMGMDNSWNDARELDNENTRSANVNKLGAEYKARLEETAKYMSEPNKAEMDLTTAFDELRLKLQLFLDISKANKWDLEKNISAAEKIRRGLEKEVNSIDTTMVNDSAIQELLKRILEVGNNLGQIQRSAGVVVKQVARCIDGMTVDVAKLGSRLIKIGDTE